MYPGYVTRRLLPALLVLPVVAVLAAGCGSGGGALSLDPVASAATKTQQTGTYSFDYTASMQVLGQQFSFTGNGQSDTANGRMQMSMDFKGLPAQLTQNGATAEFVLADKVMYLKMPFLSGMLPGGKQWMKVDLAAAAKQAGTSLGSFGQLDPQQWLQQLLASSDTQKLGTDTVQGEQMTHYRTTIDPDKAISNVPAAQRAAVRKAMKQIGVSTIPVDVWVDGKGLLRQESISLTLGQGLQNAAMKMTFDMHDFGQPVNVDVPPADQVFDAMSALKGSGLAPYLKQKS
jgi:LppX_LprAFG lipoprotein